MAAHAALSYRLAIEATVSRTMNPFRSLVASLLASIPIAASAADTAPHHVEQSVSCVPVTERGNSKLGCFVIGTQIMGKLPATPVFWHLYQYPDRASAVAASIGAHGIAVESLGKSWLLNVAEADWSPAGGQRIARIGPLPVKDTASYTAEYMEATFVPGMRSAVHRHPGPESWYVVTGEQCVETPGKKQVIRAGESGVVEEGVPMVLHGAGTGAREALVVILHDTSKPMTAPASDWKPAGLCTG